VICKLYFFIIENEPVIENHPLSCYTSRRIDYSAKLNEILSSKIIINNKKNNHDNVTILSEGLGNYLHFPLYFKLKNIYSILILKYSRKLYDFRFKNR